MKFRRGFHHTEPMPLNTAMAWSKINLYDEKEVMFSKQFYMRGEDDNKSTPVDDYLTLHTTINPKSEHVSEEREPCCSYHKTETAWNFSIVIMIVSMLFNVALSLAVLFG